jgi:hypothetical protein
VSGAEVIPLDGFGPEFRVDGLLPLLMKGSAKAAAPAKAADKTGVDVARQLVGKVFSVSGGEVIVSATFSGRLKMRDRLFVLTDGKKVLLEAVMPMHTSVKCRLTDGGAVKKGMPVFK